MATRELALLLAMAGLGGLAACDSSGSDADGGPGYDERLDALADLVQSAADAGLTDASTLPTSGEARYDGHALITAEHSDASETTILGDLGLEVGFANSGSVSGTIGNFTDEDGQDYAGTIALTGGALDRTSTGIEDDDPAFELDASGSITDPDGVVFTLSDDSTGAGDFYGADWGYVVGGLFGSACTSGGEECSDFEGVFAGERDGGS